MKLKPEEKEQVINIISKNFEKRVSKTNIIGYEIVDKSYDVGVKLMTKKKETPPQYFTDFANEVREFMKMQIEFNAWVKKEITEMKNTPTMKKELGLA